MENLLVTNLVSIAGIILLTLLLISCDTSDSFNATGGNEIGNPGGFGSSRWLIPEDQIFDGGPGQDGIPSIDEPKFALASEIDFVPDERMVIGVRVRFGGDVIAFPRQILDWHEVVNTEIDNQAFSLIWCPLTGTGTGWSRRIDNGSGSSNIGEFGISGLLFRNNVIVYDRISGSHWSQMQLRSVQGPLGGANIKFYPVVETTWSIWKKLYPNSRVLTTDTGFFRAYDNFAYGSNYPTDHKAILFPVTRTDDRLQNKERVHGIIDSETADEEATVKVFVIDRFGEGVHLIRDRVGENEYLVAGSADLNFAVGFKLGSENEHLLPFEPVQDRLPAMMKDNAGNLWDIFGHAVEGPDRGAVLTPARSYTGYWFGWVDFFPDLEIHGQE